MATNLMKTKIKRVKKIPAMLAIAVCSATLSFHAKAQEIIGSATSTGAVAVLPGGTASGQFVAPWVDVRPTSGAPAVPVFLDGPANWFTNIVTVSPGWSLIANPYHHNRGTVFRDAVSDDTIGELFKRVPQGTLLFKFDNSTQRFSENRFRGKRWSNPSQTLVPGEGAWICNPARGPFAVTFTGNCQYGGSVAIPAGWSLISAPDCGGINFAPLVWPPPEGCWVEWHEVVFDGTNYTTGPLIRREQIDCGPVPGIGWDNMAFDPKEGDAEFTFDRSTHHFQEHTFHNGAWDKVPTVALGQAFFVYTLNPRTIRYTSLMPV